MDCQAIVSKCNDLTVPWKRQKMPWWFCRRRQNGRCLCNNLCKFCLIDTIVQNPDTTYPDFAWIAYFLKLCHNWWGLCLWFVALQQKYTDCLRICGRRTWGPSTLCLFLQRPTVFITIVWMSLQFKRSWLRSPRISQSSCNPDNRNTILFRAAIPFQLNIVVSTLQVSVAWGGKIFGLNAICPNRSRISNFPQLSCNPLESARITWNPPELCLDWKSHTILQWSMGSRFALCPNWVGWVCSFVWWPRTVAGWGQSRRNQTRLAWIVAGL